MNFRVDEIISILDGEVIVKGENINITGVSIDNRKIKKNDLFFAIRGERFNPNEVVLDVFDKGASACIVDELLIDINEIPKGKTLIKVKNTKQSLGKLGKYHKEQLNTKIVAITGSVGKTSTRDMISAVLSSKYNVFKTKGNFNSDIGLPLMLLELNDSYDIAILEMGMDHAGDIKYLVDLVNPDIAVITNIGVSHIQNFDNQEGIFNAKMEITSNFSKNNTLIVNGDDKFLKTIDTTEYNVIKIGESNYNDIVCKEISTNGLSSSCKININGEEELLSINQPGKHNILNAMLSIAVGKIFDISVKEVESAFENIEKTSMRLDFIKKDNFTIINDCYNASPDSMKAAVEVLSNFKSNRRICVLGSMFELGDESLSEHKGVAEYIKEKNVDLVLVTGKYTQEFKKVLGSKCLLFKDKNSLTLHLKDIIKNEDAILIKASRGMKFETITEELNKI